MNYTEKYLFDLNGYLLVKGLLGNDDVRACLAAATELEEHIGNNIDAEPQFLGHASIRYRFDETYNCYSYKNQSGGGVQYIVDDFLNASSAFDVLVGHEPTMRYVEDLAAGPYRIGSSELRYRYKSNTTHTHMGGVVDSRNHYEFVGRSMVDDATRTRRPRDFNLLAVRILYALHDVPIEHGPLCVVPGSHKSNYFSPYNSKEPTQEVGMTPIPMEAGDAILFTENIRHGGFPNLLDAPRKTLHLMISPSWVASQSPIHWDDHVYVSPAAWNRYNEKQRVVLPPPPQANELEVKRMHAEILRLKEELSRLERPEPPPSPSFLTRILNR
jgi:hypothetical protein